MTGVRGPLHAAFSAVVLSLIALLDQRKTGVSAWGSSNSGGNYDFSIFGNALDRDWVYNSAGINIQVEGCLWAYWQSGGDENDEESGCLENSSEDGTTYWYQMSNCRRAQVVFSIYASDSSSSPSCNSGNFKETFVTKAGVSEFIYYMQSYDPNGGWSNDDGDGFNGEYPMCESNNNNNAIGLTCTSDGSFALEYFSDSYCLTRTGQTYNQLYSLNKNLQTYSSCYNIYNSGDGNGNSLVQYLISISDPCSELDSGLCTDNEAMQNRLSSSSTSKSTHFHSSAMSASGKTWLTKLKYVVGGLLLLASFVMFTGILFTNRRRRRALMQRKYRQAKRSGEDRSRRSSRSKSKSRDGSRKTTRRSSKSREPRKSSERESDGVFT